MYNEFYMSRVSFSNTICRDPMLYRPPFGNTNANVRTQAAKMGLRGVLWNLDTNDWQYADTNPTLMFSQFNAKIASLKPTGIVQLQHDLLQGSVNAVTTFINTAQANGYSLVTIERCLWGPNFQRHPSWVYMVRTPCNLKALYAVTSPLLLTTRTSATSSTVTSARDYELQVLEYPAIFVLHNKNVPGGPVATPGFSLCAVNVSKTIGTTTPFAEPQVRLSSPCMAVCHCR